MSHASPVASVAYDADAALNKEVREAMATTTLGAFLEERGTAAQPVTLASDDTVGYAMEARARDTRAIRAQATRGPRRLHRGRNTPLTPRRGRRADGAHRRAHRRQDGW